MTRIVMGDSACHVCAPTLAPFGMAQIARNMYMYMLLSHVHGEGLFSSWGEKPWSEDIDRHT